MKKIITALTVTALAIGSVFAQAKVEYTQKAFLYSPKGNKMELAGYDGNDGNIKFEIKNAQAGAWLTIKAALGTAEKYDGSKAYAEGDGKPGFSEYTGWVKFGEGLFKLQAGVWDERVANRFTGLAGKWQGSVYERYKLGVAGGKIANDIDNITNINGVKVLSSVLSFTGEAFNAKAAVLRSYNALNDKHGVDYGTLDLKSGFALEADTTIGEGTKLVVDFKSGLNNQIAFGAFIENTTLKENLDFLVGFSGGIASNAQTGTATTTKNDNDTDVKQDLNAGYFEYAVDLRAKYALSDTVGITTMHNLSYIGTTKKTTTKYTGTGAGRTVNSTENADTNPAFNLWDMVSLDAKLSDKITAFFTVEWEYKDLLHETTGGHHGELDLIPSIKYQPVKGVDMTAGLIIYTYGWSRPETTKFSVPFLLHVSL